MAGSSGRRRIAWVSAAVAGVYLASLLAVVVVGHQDGRHPADAIVVLGAAQYNGRPSPVLRARLDHALELYSAGLAPIILVTGGVGAGDRLSEATVGEEYLLRHGIPPAAVLARPEGRSTEASMESVGAWVRVRGAGAVLLVSDPFHMLRLRLEARRTGITAYTSPTSSSPISASWRHELPFLLAEAAKVPVILIRSW